MATRKLTVLNPTGYQEVLQASDTIDQLAVDNLTVGAGSITGVVTSINGQDGAVTINTGSGATDLLYSASTNTMESSSGNNAVIPLAVANGDDGLILSTDKAALDTLAAATTVDGGTYAT